MSEPAVDVDEWCIRTAIQQAAQSMHEKGIPIGAALFQDAHLGFREKVKLLGMGRNQRIQKGSATLHGEISALENAGRLSADAYKKCTMYTTLSPCSMCTGAILLYGIPRVVIGENTNFVGEEELLRSRGVEVIVLDDKRCKKLMSTFIQEHPEVSRI